VNIYLEFFLKRLRMSLHFKKKSKRLRGEPMEGGART